MKRPGWGILIVILLGGWLLNVASGWVCEQIRPESYMGASQGHPPSPAEVAWWQRYAQTDWPKMPNTADRASSPGAQSIILRYSEWPASRRVHWVLRNRAGWPLISMEGARWIDTASRPPRFDSMLGDSEWRPYLNLRPLWPGTIINTLFYALPLLGVYYILQAMRRRRRIRRGKCPACNYDLRGTDHTSCPECGAASFGPGTPRQASRPV